MYRRLIIALKTVIEESRSVDCPDDENVIGWKVSFSHLDDRLKMVQSFLVAALIT